ncbi:MFS transporter [Anabaena sp. UHCC 0204]|uniref:MFS transporter n=1 Tax=Anabaena sp. UHCC 0204 TaxID=2590009 RepID=UPI001C2C2E48
MSALILKMTGRDRQLLVLLATGSLIVMTGGVIAPIFPEIVTDLDLSPALAGYLVSSHFLTVAIFSPILGILADRLGQVRILVVSLVFYALFGMAGGLMQSFLPMLITRGLVGAASGGIAAASLGLLVKMYDSSEERSQAIAYVSSVLTVSNIIYPVLAGLVGGFHWRLVFCLYGLALPLGLLVVLTLQPKKGLETSSSESSVKANNSDQLIQALKNPFILQIFLTLCLTAATAYAVIIYLPLYLKATMNSTTVLNGIVLASQALGATAISAFGVRRLVQRFGLISTIGCGFGCMALPLMIIPQLQDLVLLFPTTIIFGVGLGIVVPSLYNLLSNLAPSEYQSSILAAGTGANFLGQFLCPSLFGLVLSDQGLIGVFYVAASLPLMLGLLMLVNFRGEILNEPRSRSVPKG